ncbi:MAG TPA: hypothetical protein VHF58_03235 [Solirubrobacterales bacterium]|nr:hypothetical protein [Solirubrobacterales bacterium]
MTERDRTAKDEGAPERSREESAKLPAGLDEDGRDEALTSGRDVHPTGERADHGHSVPGTRIGDGPRPAAEGDETERVREGSDSA